MFKSHIGITPLPINNLFTVNNAQHTYYTRQINSLHTQIGKNEKVYKLFSFHEIIIWNHMSKKIYYRCIICMLQKYQKGIYNVIRSHIELHRNLEHLKYKSIFDGFDIN